MRRIRAATALGLVCALTAACAAADVEPERPSPPGTSVDPRSEADRNRTGAGTTVEGTGLGGRSFATLEEMLSRVAGLQVVQLADGGITLRVRGGSTSFLEGVGDSEPLLIVDGLPVQSVASALSEMNPEQVGRIEVLRDASSTSMYGTRGANGVVLITMKRGAGGG